MNPWACDYDNLITLQFIHFTIHFAIIVHLSNFIYTYYILFLYLLLSINFW